MLCRSRLLGTSSSSLVKRDARSSNLIRQASAKLMQHSAPVPAPDVKTVSEPCNAIPTTILGRRGSRNPHYRDAQRLQLLVTATRLVEKRLARSAILRLRAIANGALRLRPRSRMRTHLVRFAGAHDLVLTALTKPEVGDFDRR